MKKTLLFLLAAIFTGAAFAEEPVYIPDPALKACIEAWLGITDPTPTDMLALKDLKCVYKSVAELTGLEYATNLRALFLQYNRLTDISALSGLTNLELLRLSGNRIADISALSGLTKLSGLSLRYNEITDILALSGLTKLTVLDLYDNETPDILPLSGLTNLRELTLDNNGITDISALSGLTNLTLLDLDRNQVTDISALSQLTNLQWLSFDTSQIVDISALAGLTKLTYLNLHTNHITDMSHISVLSGLTNLKELNLHSNQITDISALSGVTNLEYLVLENNQVTDISGLAGLTKLSNLILRSNRITDILALLGHTKLYELDLHCNPLSREAHCIQIPAIEDANPALSSVKAYNPYKCGACSDQFCECVCPGNMGADQQVDLEDLQELACLLVGAGLPFVVPVDPGHCGDTNGDSQLDLEDLQAIADILLDAGSPFIAPCFIPLVWVFIDDPGVTGHEGFIGYMSKYETTNAQYCQYLNSALVHGLITVHDNVVYAVSDTARNEAYFETYLATSFSQIVYSGGTFSVRTRDGYYMGNHPVVEVSWYGATAFCDYYGYRLPTEWEWQAVADYDGSFTYGCGTTIDQSKANYDYANPLGLSDWPYTSPVGYYPAYGYGMCDMAGNVSEWTSSCYYTGCLGGPRVLRGGSCRAFGDHTCTVSSRDGIEPSDTCSYYGFRVCR